MRFPIPPKKQRAADLPSVPMLLAPKRTAPTHTAENLPLRTPPPPSPAEWKLYDALRYAVPVVDAALHKIVRLCGGFRLTAQTPEAQAILDAFSENVPVNAAGCSLQSFADQMLDALLTYGNAVGELICDAQSGMPQGLVTAHPSMLEICPDTPVSCRYYLRGTDETKRQPLAHPERILFAALSPPPSGIYGVSVLRGLPALSKILLRIYECVGQNYDRAGNVRYAVTYHPDANAAAFAQSHAKEISDAWKHGIQAASYGEVQDFVAVGDIDIKVIGAENQLFDTNVPVRQLLEQIVSKLSIPPFLLGFSWSTTERMSTQQADILTSELEYFRRLLSPILRKIGNVVLHSAGFSELVQVAWDSINLQDETELAEARLKNAQAKQIEQQLDASGCQSPES